MNGATGIVVVVSVCVGCYSLCTLALIGYSIVSWRTKRPRGRKVELWNDDASRTQAWEALDLVFPNSVGRPIDSMHLLKYWYHPLRERAGLHSMGFQDLRHTAATLLLGRGVNPKIGE